MPINETELKGSGIQAPEPSSVGEDKEYSAAECEAVKLWTKRIKDARNHWEPQFKRMKRNMNFAAGLQRNEQKNLDDAEYQTNLTLKVILEKVASLYAKNPKAEWQRRERLDFVLWDGKLDSLQQAAMAVAQAGAMGQPPAPQAIALLMDVKNGHDRQDLITRIGKSLQTVYSWQVDSQLPNFKKSMKDLVQRVCVCGVAYVRMNFERDFTSSFASSDGAPNLGDLIKSAQHVLEAVKDKPDTDRQIQLTQLVQSISQSMATGEQKDISERLIFDFPNSTSIIVDRKCRSLDTFDGARWIAQEYIKPLDEINEFFELDIEQSSELTQYSEDGAQQKQMEDGQKDVNKGPLVCLWEVFDIKTKSTFFLLDGHKGYIQEPQALTPQLSRFWPIFGLAFNKVITEPGLDATVFPPSDVDLIRSPQKEWNRTRNELRGQRIANAAKYMVRKGMLTEVDKDKLENAPSNSVIELEGLPPGEQPGNFLQPLRHDPIQPALYDTKPLEHDIQMAVGVQQANIGPVSRVTATESSIAENSKMSTTASSIDELDELLSALAKAGGEMLLQEMSEQSVKRIAGVGAVWPDQNREDFLNEIYLDTKAASSGRPNRALDVQNMQIIGPLLLQAGANPASVIEELVKRLDEGLDVSRFISPMPPMAPQQNEPQAKTKPGQKFPNNKR